MEASSQGPSQHCWLMKNFALRRAYRGTLTVELFFSAPPFKHRGFVTKECGPRNDDQQFREAHRQTVARRQGDDERRAHREVAHETCAACCPEDALSSRSRHIHSWFASPRTKSRPLTTAAVRNPRGGTDAERASRRRSRDIPRAFLRQTGSFSAMPGRTGESE